MAVLNILTYGDPRLRRVAKPMAPEEITPDFLRWLEDFTETMYVADGIGLAAPQVGVDKQVVVVDTEYVDTGVRKPIVYINPRWEAAGPTCEMEEGCLSVPDIRGKVVRPSVIHIEWMDPQGKTHSLRDVDGMLARCLQHELDHLRGVLFVDIVSPSAKALLAGKLKRLAKSTQAA